MRSTIVRVVALLLVIACPAFLWAQTPAGTLQVTVVDTTGAVIAGATVTVAGIEVTNQGVALDPVKTSDQGVATIPRLAPGRYSVQAEFQGFETRRLPDVRVRSGNNK